MTRPISIDGRSLGRFRRLCLYFGALLLALVLVTVGRGQETKTAADPFAKIDRLAADGIRDLNMPSIAIGIVLDGKTIYAKGFGYADKEKKKLANADTVYQLGSVTKTFTGNLLARLILDKKISLEDPLEKYFPMTVKIPTDPNRRVITIKDIATHSAEFPRYPDNIGRVDGDPLLGFSKTQLYKGIELVRIDNPIGVRYLYSNFGYGVLGTALENATNRPLANLFKEQILRPIGMKSSSLILNDKIRANLATAYRKDDPSVRTQPWEMGALSAAGNMFSTASDMSLFMIEMLKDTEVNRIQQTAYLKVNDTWSYGLGCFPIASKSRNTRLIHHGGDLDGFASYLILYPEFKGGLIVMTNSGVRGFGELAERINDIAFKELFKRSTNFSNKGEH